MLTSLDSVYNVSRPKIGLDALDLPWRRRAPTGLSPAEEQSLISEIGSDIGSGLSTIGNILDTPGSFVRGLIAGEPGRAFGGIFDPSQRVSGEELTGDFWGGLGTEILLDPLTYLTLGAGALTKAGKLASKAGTLPKAITGAGGKLIQGAASQRLAQGLGTPFRFGVPFTDIGVGFGGPRAAELLDTVGHGIRYSAPVRGLATLFQKSSRELRTAPGQQIAQEVSENARRGIADARLPIAELTREFTDIGGRNTLANTVEGVQDVRTLQRAVEGIDLPLAGPLAAAQPGIERIKTGFDDYFKRQAEMGMPIKQVQDDYAEYLTRQQVQLPGAKPGFTGQTRALPTGHRFEQAREDILRNIPRGTDALSEMSMDPMLVGAGRLTEESATEHILRKYLDWDVRKEQLPILKQAAKDARDALKQIRKTGTKDDIRAAREAAKQAIESYKTLKGVPPQAKALADRTSGLDPRFVDPTVNPTGVGEFTRHPVELFDKYAERAEDTLASLDGFYKLISQEAVPLGVRSNEYGMASRLLPDGPHTNVWDVLVKAGLAENGKPTHGALEQVMQRLGGLASPDDLKNYRLPQEIADDALRFIQGWTAPQALHPFLNGVKKFMDFFKTHALLRPSFYVRNLVSGQFQNMIGGLWSPRSPFDAAAVMAGKSVKGLSKAPYFAGLGMNDAQATEMAMNLGFAHNVLPRNVGQTGEVLASTGGDLVSQIPGMTPAHFTDTFRELAAPLSKEGRKPGWWNPLNVGREGTFFAAKAGQEAGYWTEGINRLGPWIEGLRKGIEPEVLASKIRALQVDYQNLSKFEQRVMRNVAPFYSFTRGVLPWAVKELLEQPGGTFAQTVRGIRVAGAPDEGIVPEHVGRTAAIPLPPGESGDPRFLSSLGLMFESPLNILGGDLHELTSQVTPLAKAPIEWATGHSMFMQGPEGARALEDMDSPLGRIASNLTGAEGPVRAPTLLDTLAMNTIPSWITSIKTATDERKGLGIKALNLGTGLKVTDVPERVRDAVIREHAQELLKEEGGARTFEKVFLPKEELAKMPPEQRARAEKLIGLLKMLSERASERAEAAKKLGIER